MSTAPCVCVCVCLDDRTLCSAHWVNSVQTGTSPAGKLPGLVDLVHACMCTRNTHVHKVHPSDKLQTIENVCVCVMVNETIRQLLANVESVSLIAGLLILDETFFHYLNDFNVVW